MNSAPLDQDRLLHISSTTLSHYSGSAERFWEGTKDHDVSQNYAAFLEAIDATAPYRLLDVGCGPGRDLYYFKSLGHIPTGVEGTSEFVDMARSHSGCEVLHQNFLELDLPQDHFDGIFANASLFHVPSQELPRVLLDLASSLKPGGILFSSNPLGNNEEGFQNERYSCYHDLDTWGKHVSAAGLEKVHHYYRPEGLPRGQQNWLASVWRKT